MKQGRLPCSVLCRLVRTGWTLMRYGFLLAAATRSPPPLPVGVAAPARCRLRVPLGRLPLAGPAGLARALKGAVDLTAIASPADQGRLAAAATHEEAWGVQDGGSRHQGLDAHRDRRA